MTNKGRSVEFDIVQDPNTNVVAELSELMDPVRDRHVKIEVLVFGPGGGNPCYAVTGMSEELLLRVEDWLRKNGLFWSDDKGNIHEG
jgi:hypothetical protein